MRSPGVVIATTLFAFVLVMAVGAYAYQKYELTPKKK
jgi:hypothetical protein